MDQQTPARFDEPFLGAAVICQDLLELDRVAAGWDEPSALPRLSVGALACHLGRQVVRAAELLTVPSDLPVLGSAAAHYARAPWATATSLDDPANDRSTDDAEAALGHGALVERVRGAREAATTPLRTGTALPSVALPWQGWALRRDDFLLTRLLEIVVHSTDLVVSIDLDPPTFPPTAFDPVRDLLVELSQRRHGQITLIGALTRGERTRNISAF